MKYMMLLAFITLTYGIMINAESIRNMRKPLDKTGEAINVIDKITPETEAALEQTPADVELALKKAQSAEQLELKLQERNHELKELLEQTKSAQKKYKKNTLHPDVIEINRNIAKKKREIEATKKAIEKIKAPLD